MVKSTERISLKSPVHYLATILQTLFHHFLYLYNSTETISPPFGVMKLLAAQQLLLIILVVMWHQVSTGSRLLFSVAEVVLQILFAEVW